ncbi:MAG: hypothetical protein J7598_06850 [Mitsuaria chitosanitabida]|uniref:hypothetical protein n=1 Tax=Roseateles chitosanitabidus TaxID=65048 RepID=UPI001B13FA15|nr:hypothetical protein [Roseateles chitosanitabidus]MBO9686312.1 hypothetical protein [Roseateles chitosanitabidus]
MRFPFARRDVAIAALAALGSTSLTLAPASVSAAGKTPGRYVSGDFHNHTTCSDGSISMQKLVKKATDKQDTPWGLDWFVQAGHGGNGNRNCTLVEDASLSTPAYPYVAGKGPDTTWTASIGAAAIKGDNGGVGGNGNMWRWQSIQEYQYPVLEYLAALRNQPLFIGMESVVAGHEHTSMSIVTGQMPMALDNATLPASGSYAALGNANALAQWSYCFDRGDTDKSRGNVTGSAVGNNWNCAVPGSNSTADVSWNAQAQKLLPASGAGVGTRGHLKTLEALKWMAQYHPDTSYYVPAHLERAGPFYADGNQGFNVEHLRNFNNTAPGVAFGFESQPGHGASSNRGEYQVNRNTFGTQKVDSVGGTTFGGTGVYAGIVGGVWDSLLGEGRNFWFFASSDWHNRGSFGPDDRRSTQDFYPGEYQRTYVMVRNAADKLRPQTIVNGLRSGNAWSTTGQLIDRLALVVCASYPGPAARSSASVETLALNAATGNTDTDIAGCATMGEKLVVRPGAELVVAVALRDPAGTNYSPYAFPNPSLLQVGINQPINQPVLDHVDLIRGLVSGYRQPGAADYAGEWPRNTDWLRTDGTTTGLANVPAAAKNTTAAVIRTFNGAGASPWVKVSSGVDNTGFLKMSYRIPAVTASQYVRLRGTNMPASVPYETDASGNPLADLYTNANDTSKLRIPCTTVGSNVPVNGTTYTGNAIDGCPAHLPVVGGQKYVAYDVAAWSDLWFYSNPVYIEVSGSTTVAGVK